MTQLKSSIKSAKLTRLFNKAKPFAKYSEQGGVKLIGYTSRGWRIMRRFNSLVTK